MHLNITDIDNAIVNFKKLIEILTNYYKVRKYILIFITIIKSLRTMKMYYKSTHNNFTLVNILDLDIRF